MLLELMILRRLRWATATLSPPSSRLFLLMFMKLDGLVAYCGVLKRTRRVARSLIHLAGQTAQDVQPQGADASQLLDVVNQLDGFCYIKYESNKSVRILLL